LGYFGNKIFGYPGEVCSNTYMSLYVSNKNEAENLISYMNTEFCNFFLSLRKNTQNMNPTTLKWIPKVDFSKSWTDAELYIHFNLTQDEINLIEKTIKI
jgi:site-specific DNA-methyltransferase (adenine-specific)